MVTLFNSIREFSHATHWRHVVIDRIRFASPELAGLNCRVIAFNERTMRGGVNASK
jgi:hypothetical protein